MAKINRLYSDIQGRTVLVTNLPIQYNKYNNADTICVVYHYTNVDGDTNDRIISSDLFDGKYVPNKLYVGDNVIKYSMGSILKTYEVESIDGSGIAHYKGEIDFTTKDTISNVNNSVEVVSGGVAQYEYYYLTDYLESKLESISQINLLKTKVSTYLENCSKIPTNVNLNYIQSLCDTFDDLLKNIDVIIKERSNDN